MVREKMIQMSRALAMTSVGFLSLVSLSSAQNAPGKAARIDLASATPSVVYAHALSLLRKESQKLGSLRADAEKIGRSTPVHSQFVESDPNPRDEVTDFQFYMWRSFAFDPDGAKVPKSEGPALTASQVTEDLENRFFLIKTASWHIQQGVSDEFNNYIAVCEEIVELRKKRLYADARAIARRGELEQAYQRLSDAIEAKDLMGPGETGNEQSGPEPSETIRPLAGQILEIQQSIDENLSLLSGIPVAEPPSTVAEAPASSAVGGTVGALSKLSSDVSKFWTLLASRVMSYFASVGPSEMFVLGIAGISVILLGLFLVGLVSRAPANRSEQVREVVAPADKTELSAAHSENVEISPQRIPSLIKEVESQDDGHGLIRAVKSRLDSEAWLVSLVEYIGQSGLSETDAHPVMEWLAGALDRVRETAMVAETANDPAMLVDLFASMQRDELTTVSSDSNRAVAKAKSDLAALMLAGISEARDQLSYSAESFAASKAA